MQALEKALTSACLSTMLVHTAKLESSGRSASLANSGFLAVVIAESMAVSVAGSMAIQSSVCLCQHA